MRPLATSSKTLNNALAHKHTGFTLIELVLVIIVIGILVGLLLPAVRTARPAARRMQCSNNLKQLGLAMHNYHLTWGCFPPAYTVDDEGNRLHSWRTLLLPYLEQRELYEKLDLSKPWNDPANLAVFGDQAPSVFRCPSNSRVSAQQTAYTVIVNANSCFPGESSVAIPQIKDGTSNTLLVLEAPVGHEVQWMSPDDIAVEVLTNLNQNAELAHESIVHVSLADGAVIALPRNIAPQHVMSLITIAAGDTINRDEF